jgi:hypothetical protein
MPLNKFRLWEVFLHWFSLYILWTESISDKYSFPFNPGSVLDVFPCTLTGFMAQVEVWLVVGLCVFIPKFLAVTVLVKIVQSITER